jgi:RNA polymerase sigma-70 factor (ECF subfamily)
MFSKEVELDLLKRVSNGDETAFRKLYDQTYGVVKFYLKRQIRDESLIDDVLVETYAAVWKGAGNFKGKSKVTTWIIGIARNLAFKELRKVKYHENIDDYRDIANGTIPNAEPLDRRRILKKAIGGLTTKHREVLDLVFFHEMTYPEVSALLGIPVNTVKTRIFYAKSALKKRFKKMGITNDDI